VAFSIHGALCLLYEDLNILQCTSVSH